MRKVPTRKSNSRCLAAKLSFNEMKYADNWELQLIDIEQTDWCLNFRNIGTKEGTEPRFIGNSLTYIEIFNVPQII